MSETKRKLLDTSLDLIWQHSYGSVSVDDICKASGVKKGSFYHFFASKSDLIVAAYEEHWSKYKLTYEEVFDKKKPGLKRFEDWCSRVIYNQQEIFDKKGKVLGCPYATVGSEMGTQDENVRKKSKEIFERGEQYIAVAIADAIAERTLPATLEPERLSQEIMSYMIGVLLNARVQNDPGVIRRDLRKGVFSLLGIKLQSEAA